MSALKKGSAKRRGGHLAHTRVIGLYTIDISGRSQRKALRAAYWTERGGRVAAS